MKFCVCRVPNWTTPRSAPALSTSAIKYWYMVPIKQENARQCTQQAELVKHIAQISNENNKTIHLVNSTATSIACCYRAFIITA